MTAVAQSSVDAWSVKRRAHSVSRRNRILAFVLALATVSIAVAMVPRQSGPVSTSVSQGVVWQNAERGDLKISVLERGNLESQTNIDVVCEVEDVRRDSINGTIIQWIIPNGSSVKKGDLLVQLDATPMQEALDDQILLTENAISEKIQAEANQKNQITQNTTAQAEAELLIKLAEMELEMYVDAENGTHKLSVEESKRAIDDLNNQILAAQATMELRREDQRGIQSLFKLGYANRNEVRRVALTYLQAEGEYAAKLNRLQTELAALKKKENYEQRMELLRLEGKLKTAQRGLEQVLRNNEARLAQMDAIFRAREESQKKEQERLDRYKMELEKCRILAPQDGMVAYASSRVAEIREGIPVIYQQKLLSIPNLSSMQVRTSVHESVLDQIKPGQKVQVRVDAFPDRLYAGSVKSVAVLPDQNTWLGSDTKVYETIVTIDEKVEQLKPGMTAVSEIEIATLKDVVHVPLHAVVERNRQPYAIVRLDDGLELRRVELGLSSDTRVEIKQGLSYGEQVALNPQEFIDSLLIDD